MRFGNSCRTGGQDACLYTYDTICYDRMERDLGDRILKFFKGGSMENKMRLFFVLISALVLSTSVREGAASAQEADAPPFLTYGECRSQLFFVGFHQNSTEFDSPDRVNALLEAVVDRWNRDHGYIVMSKSPVYDGGDEQLTRERMDRLRKILEEKGIPISIISTIYNNSEKKEENKQNIDGIEIVIPTSGQHCIKINREKRVEWFIRNCFPATIGEKIGSCRRILLDLSK